MCSRFHDSLRAAGTIAAAASRTACDRSVIPSPSFTARALAVRSAAGIQEPSELRRRQQPTQLERGADARLDRARAHATELLRASADGRGIRGGIAKQGADLLRELG